MKNKKIIISTIMIMLSLINFSVLTASAMKNEKNIQEKVEVKTTLEATEFMKKIKESKSEIMNYINNINLKKEEIKNFDELDIKKCKNFLNSIKPKLDKIKNYLESYKNSNVMNNIENKESKKVLKGIDKLHKVIFNTNSELKTKQEQINFSNNPGNQQEIEKIKEKLVDFKEIILNIKKTFKEDNLQTIRNHQNQINDIYTQLDKFKIIVLKSNDEEAKNELKKLYLCANMMIRNLNRRRQIIAEQN